MWNKYLIKQDLNYGYGQVIGISTNEMIYLLNTYKQNDLIHIIISPFSNLFKLLCNSHGILKTRMYIKELYIVCIKNNKELPTYLFRHGYYKKIKNRQPIYKQKSKIIIDWSNSNNINVHIFYKI